MNSLDRIAPDEMPTPFPEANALLLVYLRRHDEALDVLLSMSDEELLRFNMALSSAGRLAEAAYLNPKRKLRLNGKVQ